MAGPCRVIVSETADEVRIAVKDSGVGIAPEDHERVFEEFRQVGDPADRQPGSGLGLAVTKRLAEAHQGHIELEFRAWRRQHLHAGPAGRRGERHPGPNRRPRWMLPRRWRELTSPAATSS